MAAYPYYPVQYGNPYSYLPQGYQPMQQPQMMQNPQMQSQSQQSPTASGIIWVSGAQEAGMYPVAPNNAVALWEQSGKTIYLKSADATGKPTMKVYDLVERTDSISTASAVQDEKSFATKDDVAALATAVKGILGDLETVKGDLYGVAGRKKTAKKEVEDDA